MRLYCGLIVILTAAVATASADVTIRYRIETSSPMGAAANRVSSTVIHMKGNKGVTIDDHETTIVDFARQQVTVIDTVRRKYAVFPVSEYADKMAAGMNDAMPQQGPEVAEVLKSMKTACETKKSGLTETIQGVQAEDREVTCTMTMSMPDSVKGVMPEMGMKFVTRIWTATPNERLRVPGLWQLSGFELWQDYFMNPAGAIGRLVPEGMKPMAEAMQKDQSATLRSTMEMSMQMPMPGMPAGDKPMMKIDREVTALSTELLDDSLFSVPSDCSPEPFEDLMKGITSALMASVKEDEAKAPPVPESTPISIPENVKAFIPMLIPLSQPEPEAAVGSDGKKLQGMVDVLVTVGPKGNVERAEVLSGPEGLRKAAMDAVRQWTYRPVIRNGEAVTAYTEANVDFTDYSKGPPDAASFQFTPEMAAAQDRMEELRRVWPRSPAQELADLEQDAGGGDKSRRYYRLSELAFQAAETGDNDKATAYATELLTDAQADARDWNYGNAIHAGHSVLGLVALRGGDVSRAREQLLEAGKTPGSGQLNSFGPNMMLAAELLKQGERDSVLQYFDLCRKFWKMGGAQLDSWSETVRKGGTPSLPTNMPQ